MEFLPAVQAYTEELGSALKAEGDSFKITHTDGRKFSLPRPHSLNTHRPDSIMAQWHGDGPTVNFSVDKRYIPSAKIGINISSTHSHDFFQFSRQGHRSAVRESVSLVDQKGEISNEFDLAYTFRAFACHYDHAQRLQDAILELRSPQQVTDINLLIDELNRGRIDYVASETKHVQDLVLQLVLRSGDEAATAELVESPFPRSHKDAHYSRPTDSRVSTVDRVIPFVLTPEAIRASTVETLLKVLKPLG